MKLRDWLKDRKITGEEFARRCGVSQGAISKIVRGNVWPAAGTVAAIERETKGAVMASDILATVKATRKIAAPKQSKHAAAAE